MKPAINRWLSIGVVGLTVVLSVFTACRHVVTQPERSIVWPPPPDTPRIIWEGAFSSPRQLGISGRWLKKLRRALTGETESDYAFTSPYGVFVDSRGDIFVTDTDGPAIHIFEPGRNRYSTLTPNRDFPLQSPIGVVAAEDGQIWITDSSAGQVWVVDRKGKRLAGPSPENFLRPTGIALDSVGGLVYVVDTLAHDVKCFDLTGQLVKRIGRRGTGNVEFNFPTAIFVDPAQRIVVGDTMNFRVQILDPEGRLLGMFGQAGDGAGFFSKIKGVAMDRFGHVYVSDGEFDVVQMFDVQGNFLLAIGETGLLAGQFRFPAGVFVDGHDRLYVADKLNRRIQIFRYLGENHGIEN